MLELLTGTLLLSLLHAAIPNHWAPVLAVARAERWPLRLPYLPQRLLSSVILPLFINSDKQALLRTAWLGLANQHRQSSEA
jgi:hypothetical protein